MNFGLNDRVAVIIGAASGIGRSTAVTFASEGSRVVLADVDDAGVRESMDAIDAAERCRAVRCDVGDEAAVQSMLDGAARTEGRVDIVVNCAGIAPRLATLAESTTDEWERVLRVHLRGTYLVTRQALRLMLSAGTRGAVVNVASIAALRGMPTLGAYGAAKAAIVQLTRTAAREAAPAGIRVNAVCPGWIETPLLGGIDRAPLRAETPLGRLGTPREAANVIVFLASEAASFVTGSTVVVDGGLVA